MNNSRIKAVIFDLGKVLIDFDHMIAANRVSKFTDRTPQEIFSLFFDSKITCLFEKGEISPSDFFSEVKKRLNLSLSYEDFLPIWNEIFFLTPKNIEVFYLALQLKGRYTVALLSNINVLHFEYLRKVLAPVFDAFHRIFLSYELHLRKPDALIYEKITELLHLKPEEIFYTDDRLELVESAKTKGINSFQFTNIRQLKTIMLSLGMDVN